LAKVTDVSKLALANAKLPISVTLAGIEILEMSVDSKEESLILVIPLGITTRPTLLSKLSTTWLPAIL
jgi:hypothetical protein